MSSATTAIIPVGLGTVVDENQPGFSFTFFRFFESYGNKTSATFIVTTYLAVLEDIPEGNTGINATLTVIDSDSVSKEFIRVDDTIEPLVFEIVITFAGTSADAGLFDVVIDGVPKTQLAAAVYGISSPIIVVTNDYPDSALTGTGSFEIEANWGPTRLFTPSNTINCPISINSLVNSPNNVYSGGNLFLVQWTNSLNPGNGVLISVKPEGAGGLPIPVAYTTSPGVLSRGFTLMPTMAGLTPYLATARNWEITLNAIQAGAANPNESFLISEDSITAITFVEVITDLTIVGATGGLFANFGGVGSGNGSGISFFPTPPVGAIPDPILLADPSGIYTIVPGLFHDVLYNRNGDETVNLPIPTPFGRTAYLGE